MTEITREELAHALDRSQAQARAPVAPPVVLEALPDKYFRKGHLPGARRIDYLAAVDQVAALGVAHDTDIVVYCASMTCENSHIAAGALTAAGYHRVRVYREGKQGWQDAGLALERDER